MLIYKFYFKDYANYLLKNADLLSPDEYLSYHKKPINIILESGKRPFLLKFFLNRFK